MSKYGAVKTNGYASKREAKRAADLKLLEKAGKIFELREQVTYVLADAVTVQGRRRPSLRYIADFVYLVPVPGNSGMRHEVVEDCKGFRTPEYRIKRHLMKSVLNIDILET